MGWVGRWTRGRGRGGRRQLYDLNLLECGSHKVLDDWEAGRGGLREVHRGVEAHEGGGNSGGVAGAVALRVEGTKGGGGEDQ